MMKFIVMIMFMNFMIVFNNYMVVFYYNLCYLFSFIMIFMFMFKDINWFNITLMFGCNYYSLMLGMLSFWILGLMFMSLKEYYINGAKLVIFVNMLLVLIMFFLSIDLILFYLMFEVSLIPTFFLVIYWGVNPERVSSGFYMMVYMLLISFPMLVYIFSMYMYGMTFKFSLMISVMCGYSFSFWSFLMIYMAFFIKMPMYLFHIWLPKAHTEAPVYGSMILAGVLLKMGSYGLIRVLEVFYFISMKYGYMIFSLSMVGSILIGILCLTQVDMKSVVAYSSVVHMNLMISSLMTHFKVGMVGSYLMMIGHGLCSSGMFYIVNLYYLRSGSRLLFLNKGVISNLPSIVMWWFLFCIINFSFPLSLNFIGESLMLMSILNWDIGIIYYLMLICFFSSAYSLYLFSYVSHGKNIYYENKIYGSNLKEFMVLVNHFFPMLMFLLNMIIFM